MHPSSSFHLIVLRLKKLIFCFESKASSSIFAHLGRCSPSFRLLSPSSRSVKSYTFDKQLSQRGGTHSKALSISASLEQGNEDNKKQQLEEKRIEEGQASSSIEGANKKGSQESEIQQEQQQQIPRAIFPKSAKKNVVPEREEDAKLLESKGFGIRMDDGHFELKDYEVLYLLYTGKLNLSKEKAGGKEVGFEEFVQFALKRDPNAWTRFLIFRDLRSIGYVVREGFGFPIDFRVYERGDYGQKAAKYIVFGLNEGKTMTVSELRRYVNEMSVMGKEAVISVVERRGEVIYYKVAKWRPIKAEV